MNTINYAQQRQLAIVLSGIGWTTVHPNPHTHTHTSHPNATKQQGRDCWQKARAEQIWGNEHPSALHRTFCLFVFCFSSDHICSTFITHSTDSNFNNELLGQFRLFRKCIHFSWIRTVSPFTGAYLAETTMLRYFLHAYKVTVLFSLFLSTLFICFLETFSCVRCYYS